MTSVEILRRNSQGHSRTLKDSQGHSRTLKDSQGHSRIVKDTQGQWYLSDITSTAFMRWILKTRPLVHLAHSTHTPHCSHTIGLTSSGVFQPQSQPEGLVMKITRD